MRILERTLYSPHMDGLYCINKVIISCGACAWKNHLNKFYAQPEKFVGQTTARVGWQLINPMLTGA